MELRHLETFACIADLQSFTKAADALHLTQPAVTRQIGALERELKTRLLERMGRRVQKTAAGEALYGYAVEMLRLRQEAVSAVQDVAAGVSGRLTVGASSTAATYVLPLLLHQFHAAYPAVELCVQTSVSGRIVDMVQSSRVDCGIVMDFRATDALIETPLSEYATVAVVYPAHPLAASLHVTASELAASPLILMASGTNLREYVDRLLSEAGIVAQIALELDNVEAIKKMIEAQLGISLLPQVALESETASGRLIALPLHDVPHARRRISVIHRKDKYLSAALKAFMQMLRDTVGMRD